MATLEKIRKRSVLLIVVIGVALLAFILGDALTNGRTLLGDSTTVAKLGDVKVDINEYQQRVDMLQASLEGQNVDAQYVSQQAISSLLDEKLLDAAAAGLGIEVSDEVVTYYIFDQPLQPVGRFIQANAQYMVQVNKNVTQENIESPRYWYNVIFNPAKYGVSEDAAAALKQNWIAMEEDTKKAARRMVYQDLLSGLVQPNAVERKDMFAGEYESTTVDFASKLFAEADLANYKVTDADLKAEYEKCKNEFKVLEDTKTVGFISYKVLPSEADVKNANKLQSEAFKAFRLGEKLGKDLVKAGVMAEKASYSAGAIPDSRIAAFVNTAPVDSVGVFENGGSFTLVKVISNDVMANEGVMLVPMMVKKENEAALKTALAADTLAIDSISLKFTAEQLQVAPAENIMLHDPAQRERVPAQLAAQLDSARNGDVLTIDETNAQYTTLAYVKSVKPKVPVYDIETVSYTLYPSRATIEAASDALAKYASANSSAAKFGENAKKAGYTYQSVPVSGSTPGFKTQPEDQMLGQYYPMGHKLVSWAMTEAEAGDISAVMTNDNSQNPYVYIAMVESEYEDFAPYNDSTVKRVLEQRVRTQKAGDAWVKQFSGKGDINATAEAMGVSVNQDEMVRFGVPGRINDPKVRGRITGSKPGSKVYVVKGDDGVYAFVVKSKNPAAVTSDKTEANKQKRNYNLNYQGASNLHNMLRGNNRLENNLYKMTGAR